MLRRVPPLFPPQAGGDVRLNGVCSKDFPTFTGGLRGVRRNVSERT